MFDLIILGLAFLAGVIVAGLVINHNPGIIGITLAKLQAIADAAKKV
jgi:hypothetical protein